MHAVLSFSPLFYHLCVFFSFFFFFFSISSTPAVLCILKPPIPAKNRGIAWCAEPEGWHRASWMAIHTLIISFPREEGGGGKGRVPHHLVSTTPTRTRRASSALVHCVMSRAPPLLLVAYVESVSPQSLPRWWYICMEVPASRDVSRRVDVKMHGGRDVLDPALANP